MSALRLVFLLVSFVSIADATWNVAEPLPKAVAVATADVNRDGRGDILVGTASGVVLILGSPDGQFDAGTPILTGGFASNIGAADLDRDGTVDVIVFLPGSGLIVVLKGNGDGTFEDAVHLSASSYQSTGLVVADFNGDGSGDLACGQFNGVALFLGNGDLSFRQPAAVVVGATVASIAAADFDADSVLDLAVTTLWDVFFLRGTGGGTFAAAVKIQPQAGTRSLAAADLNADGVADLAGAADVGLAAWLSNKDGSFRPAQVLKDGSAPTLSVSLADLNGDNITDAVFGNYYNGKVTIAHGKGDGTFVEVSRVPTFGDVFGVTLADLNGDGRSDLTASSYSSSTALVAMGLPDGTFEPATYFGSPDGSFFRRDTGRTASPQIASVVPLRKSAYLVTAGGVNRIASFRDYPMDAQFADFNREGKPDFVVSTVNSLVVRPGDAMKIRIHLLSGQDGGSFAPPREVTSQSFTVSNTFIFPLLLTGEFTGDQNPDIVLTDGETGSLRTFRGNGDGSFERIAETPALAVLAVLSTDFNGDGLSDVAALVRSGNAAAIKIYLGSAGGRLRESSQLEACESRLWTRGDFNGDTRPDIAVICSTQTITLLNTGNGTFQRSESLLRAQAPVNAAILAEDFNRDGKDDLLIARSLNTVWGGGMMLLGNAAGGFTDGPGVALSPKPIALVSTATNPDSWPDVFVLSGSDGKVSLVTAPGNPNREVAQ